MTFDGPLLKDRYKLGPKLGSGGQGQTILTRVKGGGKKKRDAELDAALLRVNTFEKELVDDGALILKFWFHLSKQQQRKRFKKLEKDPDTRWRVTKEDWEHHELYNQFRKVCERTLRETDTGEAPWTVIEGADARFGNAAVATLSTEAGLRGAQGVDGNLGASAGADAHANR